jgi:HK97 gp10 family phage protein
MAHALAVVGLTHALNQLEGVERSVRKKLLRKFVNEATKLVLKDAKQLAPVAPLGTLRGLYRKSLGRKIKSYQGGVVQVGLVGARGGFRYPAGVASKGKSKGDVLYQDPVKIAHLLEKGTAHAAACPHLRPALDKNRAAIEALSQAIIGLGALAQVAKGAA